MMIALVGVVALAACSSSPEKDVGTTDSDKTKTKSKPMGDVEVAACRPSESQGDGPVSVLKVTNSGPTPSRYQITVVFETNKGSRLDAGNATVLDLAPKQTKEVEAVSLNADANARLFKCRVTEVTRTPEGQPETGFSSASPSDSPSATWRAGRDVDDEALRKCRVDTRTVRTAQEAYFARVGRYAASTEELVSAGMLSEPSALHRVEFYPPDSPSTTDQYGSTGSPYFLVVIDPMCGEPGNRVGQTPTDY